ncbi:P2Y purinoceptor 8 [Acipenser ruthenus]|uniref:P2Y purinoceptor 8 n=1 Tax=Acipenser ruthenus TaxID=7906 RepID=A0A444UVZ1_ACIRT|nr:P2Y purinoceptor 8 [Acipenser ruthenus]
MDSLYTNSTAVPNSIAGALNNSEHWPCFQNSAGAAFFAGMELLTAAVGFPANVMVLWVLLQRKNTISSSKVFILNLAAMDAFVCLNTPLDIYNSLILGNNIVFIVTYFIYFFNLIGSPMFLCCICVERYMAVVYPVHFLRSKSLAYRGAICAVAWAVTVAISGYLAANIFNLPAHLMAGYTAALLVVMVFCNVSLLRSLRQSGPGQEEVHPIKKKAFKTVFTIFIISLVFYFPLVAIYPFKSYFNPVVFKCYVRPVCSSFAMPSSSIQPLLYLYNAGKLTRAQFPCCVVPSPSP